MTRTSSPSALRKNALRHSSPTSNRTSSCAGTRTCSSTASSQASASSMPAVSGCRTTSRTVLTGRSTSSPVTRPTSSKRATIRLRGRPCRATRRRAGARGGRVLRIPARRTSRGGGGGTARRARPGRARLPCERRTRARLGLVPAARRGLRAAGGPRRRANRDRGRLRRPRMRIDVFTLVPHAFAWLTEQRPIAAVLGTELELRLFSYRDMTPLRAGQVDDEPYGGGAGMVLRVDVVAAALDAVYGDTPPPRVIALTPQGRPLTQAVVEELGQEDELTLLSARFEGFDERIVQHLASDAISIGPYVLSNGDLPAMVLLDAVARRLPGALSEGSGELESFSDELGGGLEYPHYTRPAEFRGWKVPEVLLSGDHARIEAWRREGVR